MQNISKRLEEKANYDSVMKDDLLSAIEVKSEKLGDRGRRFLKGNQNKILIFLGIGVVVAIGYYVWKNKEFLFKANEVTNIQA